jgi:hypothetical protein
VCWWLQDTVGQLKKKYHSMNKKYYPARQRLTLPAKEGQKSGEVLKDSSKLSEYGLSTGSVVLFKDLGTQVRMALNRPAIQHEKGPGLLASLQRSRRQLIPTELLLFNGALCNSHDWRSCLSMVLLHITQQPAVADLRIACWAAALPTRDWDCPSGSLLTDY